MAKKGSKTRENKGASLPAVPPPSALTDRETRKKVLRVLLQLLVLFMVLIAMIWARTYYSQQKFYRDGEKALKVHNYKDAMTGYEWAIRMYTPFSGKVKDSCQKLWNIGEEYERRGKLDWALIAYRGLRSSIYAVRSFYTPHEEWIARTDARIARILQLQKMQEGLQGPGYVRSPGKME